MSYITGFALSLLVVAAGTFLLAKIQKEQLTKFFKFMAWALIVLGILLVLGTLEMGFLRCYNKVMRRNNVRTERFMPRQESKRVIITTDGEGSCQIMKDAGEDMMSGDGCKHNCMYTQDDQNPESVMMDEMITSLKLNPEQAHKIKEIQEKYMELEKGADQAKMVDLMKKKDAEIAQILSPEQQEHYKKMFIKIIK
jgi:hypothetical protein